MNTLFNYKQEGSLRTHSHYIFHIQGRIKRIDINIFLGYLNSTHTKTL